MVETIDTPHSLKAEAVAVPYDRTATALLFTPAYSLKGIAVKIKNPFLLFLCFSDGHASLTDYC